MDHARTKLVGKRLMLLREALGYGGREQARFARLIGCASPRYNQYEKGTRLLTLAVALRLCDQYRVTLDWLYRGDPSGLPQALAEKVIDRRAA